MTFEEMAAVVAEAHNYHRKVTGHCRATQGIKNALRAGFDYAGARHVHGPARPSTCCSSATRRSCRRCSSSWRASRKARDSACRKSVVDGHKETLEGGAESARMILKAGGRLGMGGDYGFAWNPHGDYAKELTFFVKYVGFTPLETITCATRTGAEIMGRGHEFGTVEPGKLADILVVDGDVLADIAILEDRSRFIAVMQGGVIKAGCLAHV